MSTMSVIASGSRPSSGRGAELESCWIEPGGRRAYPMAYRAYRKAREAEEGRLPRHRALGPDVECAAWRRVQRPPGVEVWLTFRPGAPPRVRRIVAEVLRAIRRGHTAGEAISRVARRFGLRQTCARAFIRTCVGYETRHPDGGGTVGGPESPGSSLGGWS